MGAQKLISKELARTLGKMMVVNVIRGGVSDKVWQLEEKTAEAESRRRRCLGE